MGVFSSITNANHTCPMPTSFSEDASEPFIGSMSFYHFNIILSGACTAVACLVIFYLMGLHATHLSKPNEQIKIMKISFLIPTYTLLSFLSVCVPKATVSVTPWLEVVQSWALGSFFLLLCEFISPSDSQRDLFFAALRVPQKKGKSPVSGLEWYRKKWIMIFQYPVVAILIAVVTDITQAAGVYCLESDEIYFAHIWLSIISAVSVLVAVMSVFNFYSTLKPHLAGHQPLAKLLAFKSIVGLAFLEGIIFMILRSTKILKPDATLTYADATFGISNMLICVEMVPFSLFFLYAYKARPYYLSARPMAAAGRRQNTSYHPIEDYPMEGTTYQGGPLGVRAWLAFLNPMEVFSAVKFAFTMGSESRKQHSYHDSMAMKPTVDSYEGDQMLHEEGG